jgi:hypothetical protein
MSDQPEAKDFKPDLQSEADSGPQTKSDGSGERSESSLPAHLKELAAKTGAVAKTMIEGDALEENVGRKPDDLDHAAAKTQEPEIPGRNSACSEEIEVTGPEGKPNYYIPALGVNAAAAGSADNASNLPAHLKELKQVAEGVARTKLDQDALKDVVRRDVTEREVKLAEEMKNRVIETPPPFQPIEKYRKSTPCSSQWAQMSGSGNIKFCEKCKLQVYDFSKTDLPEAEKIIFQREGKKDFSLYKRKDGKFLTADCPVGVRTRQTTIAVCLVAVVLVAGFIFVLASMPPPAPPPKQATGGGQASTSEAAGQTTGNVESPSDGFVDVTTLRRRSARPAANASTSPESAPQYSAPAQDAAQNAQQNVAPYPPSSTGYPAQPPTPAPFAASPNQPAAAGPPTGH